MPSATEREPRRHIAWLAAGLVGSFLVPFIFADQLQLNKDIYYGVYGFAAVGLFVGWARDTGNSLRDLVARRWRLALLLGGVFAAASAAIVLNTESAGPTPEGAELIGQLLWRGLFYGAVDGLLLSAFPILVVFAAFEGSRLRGSLGGVIAVGALAMMASLLITATYHLGYEDFRSEKVRRPMTGDLVWSIPTLATLNPIGSPIAHASLHVTSILHNSESDLFLPPH